MRNQLVILEEIDSIDFDWKYIQSICKEATKCRKLLEKSMQGKPVSKSRLTKSTGSIIKHHKLISKQIKQSEQFFCKLSPHAAKSISKQIKVLDDEITAISGHPSKSDDGMQLYHQRIRYLLIASAYGDLGTELRMYLDLIKNAAKLVA